MVDEVILKLDGNLISLYSTGMSINFSKDCHSNYVTINYWNNFEKTYQVSGDLLLKTVESSSAEEVHFIRKFLNYTHMTSICSFTFQVILDAKS